MEYACQYIGISSSYIRLYLSHTPRGRKFIEGDDHADHAILDMIEITLDRVLTLAQGDGVCPPVQPKIYEIVAQEQQSGTSSPFDWDMLRKILRVRVIQLREVALIKDICQRSSNFQSVLQLMEEDTNRSKEEK